MEENALAEVKRWRWLHRTVDLQQADMISLVLYVISQLTNFVMQPETAETDLHASEEVREEIFEKMQEAQVVPAIDDERFAGVVLRLMCEGLRKKE